MKINFEVVKAFFKRTRWIWITLGIIIFIGVILLVITAISNSKGGSGNSIFTSAKDKKKNQYDSRIVKYFTPTTGAAFKYGSPTIVNDFIYIGTSSRIGYDAATVDASPDNFFYKMDLDLNVVWEYSLKEVMATGGATLDSLGNIYFVGESTITNDTPTDKDHAFLVTLTLISLTNDGKFRWQKPISSINSPLDHGMFGVAIGTDDKIYVGHDKLFAFDTQGNILWEYPGAGKKIIGFSSTPIIDKEGFVYFASPEPVEETSDRGTYTIRLYKFNSQTGTVIFSTILGNEIMDPEGPTTKGGAPIGGGGSPTMVEFSSPSFGVGEKSIYIAVGATISKVDTSSGNLLWGIKPEGATGHFNASPVVDGEDTMYLGSKSNMEGTFFAIDKDGKTKWKKLVGADLYTSPILGDDNSVYIGSEQLPTGKFQKLNIQTGETIWAIQGDDQKKIPDFSMGSMLLYKGYVYIGVHTTQDDKHIPDLKTGALYKIKVDAYGYPQNSPWPRFHGSNENTGRSK